MHVQNNYMSDFSSGSDQEIRSWSLYYLLFGQQMNCLCGFKCMNSFPSDFFCSKCEVNVGFTRVDKTKQNTVVLYNMSEG